MAILNITADFSGLVRVLSSIDMTLKHAVRILETTFPMQPERVWTGRSESSKINVVNDETTFENEEADRKKGKQSDIFIQSEALSDAFDLEPKEGTESENS